jgi:hypothetical protein
LGAPIYVETRIRAPLAAVWDATQEPGRHVRWDLRFTDIRYLPRADPTAPQAFEYSTRLGFGLRIVGTGETVGSHEGPSTRVSALKFGSEDRKSLIREGAGYWKYVDEPDGVRFHTQYDYRTRFGALGRVLDRVAFRPLLGWATAWSFDRLRLWLEHGVDPTLSLVRASSSAVVRGALALAWLWHGLVPKLLFPAPGERAMLANTGLFPGHEDLAMRVIGAAEVLFGLAFVLLPRVRALHLVNIVGLLALAVGALVAEPEAYLAPFGPASVTIAMVGLSLVGLVVERELPSARRCLRRPVPGSPGAGA